MVRTFFVPAAEPMPVSIGNPRTRRCLRLNIKFAGEIGIEEGHEELCFFKTCDGSRLLNDMEAAFFVQIYVALINAKNSLV